MGIFGSQVMSFMADISTVTIKTYKSSSVSPLSNVGEYTIAQLSLPVLSVALPCPDCTCQVTQDCEESCAGFDNQGHY